MSIRGRWFLAVAGLSALLAILGFARAISGGGFEAKVTSAAGRDASAPPTSRDGAKAPAAPALVRPPVSGPLMTIDARRAFAVQPLTGFAPAAVKLLEGREPQWGVAVVLPKRGAVYVSNGDAPFPLASVTKVVIMLTLLDQSIGANRAVTDDEVEAMTAMITESDNDAAAALWDEVGGSDAVSAFLDRVGVTGIEPAGAGLSWGDTTASAQGIAQLLTKLWSGAMLNSEQRARALDLLSRVDDSQRWGVSAAFPGGAERLAMKDGWYPAAAGWRVTSVGFNPDASSEPMIVVALTRYQPSFDYGVETIERFAAALGPSVYGGAPLESRGVDQAGATRVEQFSPATTNLPVLPGTCDAESAVSVRAGSWQCTADGKAYDPCFASPSTQTAKIVCGARPGEPSGAFAVDLAAPPPPVQWREDRAFPWLIVLSDGTVCDRKQGPRIDDDGDQITYGCSDGLSIIGPLQRSETWSALRADPSLSVEENVPIRAAWF